MSIGERVRQATLRCARLPIKEAPWLESRAGLPCWLTDDDVDDIVAYLKLLGPNR